MKILSVKINNILSIEDAYVEFGDSGLMLVQGWNHDVGRANGAGKSAIFNAVSFALYDKLPRKVTATEVLRRGAKSGYAEVVVQIGDDRYTVKRSRPKGTLYSRGTDQLTITQAEWESKLGLNYEQFIISTYCAQGSSTRFLSTNDTGKKQFLLQLLNLEEFSSCKITADKKVKLLQEESASLKSKMDTIDSKIDAYSESLVDENVIKHHIALGNQRIADYTAEVIQLQGVPQPDLSKYKKLEEDLNAKRSEISYAKMKREMLHDQYRKLNSKIRPFSAASSCVACGASLDNAAAEAAHNREVQNKKEELAAIKDQIDSCEEILTKEAQYTEVFSRLQDKKKEESREYGVASLKIAEIQQRIALQHQELKQLNLKLENNLELTNKIQDLVQLRAKIVNNRANILRDIEIYETISAMYSPTGAQAYILDSIVDSFNDRVRHYVSFLWPNLTYELQSYKETVKGDVTAKFSEHLVMDGKPISIGSLSGGEFRALSLCVDFALIEVMERQFGISLSPIVLDEPFDGLDATGKEFIIDLLEAISTDRQVVVVDHASEVATSFSNVLMVEKRNGVTTICKTT